MKKLSKKTYFLLATISTLMGVAAYSAEEKPAAVNAPVPSVKSDAKKLEDIAEKNFEKALADAKKEGKVLMLEFTGSQWCPPCKMLHSYVLNTEKFLKHAKEKLKVVVADFDREGKPRDVENAAQYEKLAETYGLTGFPTIVLINPQTGAVSKLVGFQTQTPEALIEVVEEVSNLKK